MKPKLLIATAVVACLVSCREEVTTPVEYFPYKSEETDFWGMMGPDGSVLFDGKFMFCPSVSSRGVFLAIEENEMLSFYTAEATPHRITHDFYTAAKPFLFADYTPVRKVGEQHITIIDKGGNDVASLSPRVADVGFYASGVAPFVVDSVVPLMGYIDERGNEKIAPQYAVATNFMCDVAVVAYERNGEMVHEIIDNEGKTIYTFGKELQPLAWEFSDGLLAVMDKMGRIGFMDTRGKIAIEPDSRLAMCRPENPMTIPYTFKAGRAIYYDGEHYGLIDKQGKVVVEAMFENIYLGEGGLFAAEDPSHQWGCIDGNGKVVVPFEYVVGEIRPSITPTTIVVQNESHRYKLVNEKGETISRLTFARYQSRYYGPY